MDPRLSYLHGCVLLLLLCSWRAGAQAQQPPPQTDPTEAAALNAMMARLGLSAPPSWNISGGDPCSGAATDDTPLDDNPSFNPAIKCDCSDHNNTLCHITRLKINTLDVVGPIPEELRNLTHLIKLDFRKNYFTGPLPGFIGELTALKYITVGINALSGPIPKELGNLTNLVSLALGSNNFNGSLPDELGKLTKLQQLRIRDIVNGSSSLAFIGNMASLGDLYGTFTPLYFSVLRNSRISDSLASVDFSKFGSLNLLNLVANDFVIDGTDMSGLPWGLNCLQRNAPVFSVHRTASFAVDCGGSRTISGSDNAMYLADNTNLGAASYYVAGAPTWGVSTTGRFMDPPNGSYIIYSSHQFDNTLDSELFQTARMSPSSLRYYGIGLENGNYTVTLQFAEVDFPDVQSWRSRRRRIFDIYVQGERKEQNFDIRKAAGGKSFTVVKKQYVVPVTKNFVHLFWAGKGTCCIPHQGYYGPAISALSATPNFIPTFRSPADNKSRSKIAVIIVVVVGVAVFALAALAGLFIWRQKRRKILLELEELYNIVGRPNVFSYNELRSAMENFSSSNLLGEGGYGLVHKGRLSDGRAVAVKQLSQSSNQGKKQFATEIETISRVQYRNLVTLYGCCLESNTPLLVYEYLENGSLDQALFGKGSLNLDWPTRFEICLGIARGIAYLHEDSTIRIVHRDIKASNVLLDADLNPEISDFGLAKLYDNKKTHVSTKVAGTFGYLAPEYAMRGHMTEKVDVFAFGVVALETVAGESNYQNTLEEDRTYIFERVWELYENGHPLGFVDPKLSEFNSEEVIRVIRVALLCTQGSPHKRPPMSKVVSMLTGDADITEDATKPSYITEWQIKVGSCHHMSSSQVGPASTPPSSGGGGAAGQASSQGAGEGSPLTPSPLFTSIIDEGR
uniref:non-specific serine/threonine protein kinase n=1 Tax=Oryza punctata TaxID=4537 RepID=A0A0E0KV79_ORYPU